MERLTEITDDLFDISARIKSIDENYKIYYDRGTCRYELHNSAKSPSFQAVLPYKNLDKRALDFAVQSSVKNKEKILAQIDANNARVEEQKRQEIIEKAMGGLRL